MNHPILDQLSKAIQDLNQALHRILLIKVSSIFQGMSKSDLCLFEDDIKIVFGLMHIHESNDVGTFEFLHDLYFRVECVFGILILFNFMLGDDFDCHFFESLLDKAYVDLRKCALAQFIIQQNDILANSFFIAHILNIINNLQSPPSIALITIIIFVATYRQRLNMKIIYFGIQINYLIHMYYRRWTRMHLKPGLKYFVKYGVLSPIYDRFTYLMQTENPEPLQYRTRKVKVNKDKDLDTKLINNLFLKYPDLKFEPISNNVYPGRQLNSFSYAYSFINEQKKLIKQGYTNSKAFELTEEKYHDKMQRKLDQSLLSRGLAFGNRARSFLNVYQQQAEFQSRLKTQRSQRELEKYELKLRAIRQLSEEDTGAEPILNEDTLQYNRIFYDIRENRKDVDYFGPETELGHNEIPKNDGQGRQEFINRIQNRFKYLFDQFYEHAATKDRLEGLTDSQIIRQIQSSPTKIKRQMKQLVKFFESKNIKVSLVNGKVVVTGENSDIISNELKNNKYIKIALLSESLNYQKPVYSTIENATKSHDLSKGIFNHRNGMRDIRPDSYDKEDKQTIRHNKKKELELVAEQQVFYNKEAYKIFETQQERLLRLQIKYYDKLVEDINRKIDEQTTPEQKTAQQAQISQLNNRRQQTIMNFRRLKFKLEKRYKNISAEEFLFPEHEEMGKKLKFEDQVEYEQLIGYLRKKSEERRLTSLEQSKDNKISKSIRIVQVGEGVIPEGSANSRASQ